MQREKHLFGKALFLAYVLWMLWLLFGQRVGYAQAQSFEEYMDHWVNLRPFQTISNYWYAAWRTTDQALLRHIVINLAGNVLMFVPLGFFLPLNWLRFRWARWWIPTVGLVLLSIELLQMATRLGSLDVDDGILNLTGAGLGYLVWTIGYRQERDYG